MSDESKGVDWAELDQAWERYNATTTMDHNGMGFWEMIIWNYPAIRAEMRAKDERMKRLESEATLLRIDMGNVAELRAALTETYNAAMWLASDETGREVPKWVYDAIEAARKQGATK